MPCLDMFYYFPNRQIVHYSNVTPPAEVDTSSHALLLNIQHAQDIVFDVISWIFTNTRRHRLLLEQPAYLGGRRQGEAAFWMLFHLTLIVGVDWVDWVGLG